jgi:hypothetical protein
LLRGSSLTIRGQQQFDNSLLSADDSETTQAALRRLYIDSGTMQVTKGARDDDDDDDDDNEEEE